MKQRFLPFRAGSTPFILGAIALLGGLTACTTSPPTAQNSAQSSAQSSEVHATPPADHPMSSMDHGAMTAMDHSSAMDLGPAGPDYDLRFIDAMTPHHEGAVAMAQEAKQKSKRPEIQKLAAQIIAAQDQEIAQMKQWRQTWYPQAKAEPVAYDPKTQQTMPLSPEQQQGLRMSQDLGTADADFDRRFIEAMIPHHEGAITMAKQVLAASKRPEIQTMAQDIIRSQAAEIKQMQQWKQAWYGK